MNQGKGPEETFPSLTHNRASPRQKMTCRVQIARRAVSTTEVTSVGLAGQRAPFKFGQALSGGESVRPHPKVMGQEVGRSKHILAHPPLGHLSKLSRVQSTESTGKTSNDFQAFGCSEKIRYFVSAAL